MIKETKLVHSTPYLKLFDRTYINNDKEHSWHVVSRRESPVNLEDNNNTNADAVHIVGVMEDLEIPRLVVIEEYRPPIGGWTVGLPAGLIDEQESAQDAAVREMKEETGLDFTYVSESPRLFNSPGMTDESSIMVFGTVTGNISDELQEEKENIKASLLTQRDVWVKLNTKGVNFDAKSWFIFMKFMHGEL